MLPALRRLVDSVRACEERVAAVYLFGSHARGEARAGSDIDLGVVLDLPWFERLSRREQARAVLALMEAARRAEPALEVDVVVLNVAHPLAAWDAVHSGRLLWCSSMPSVVEFGTWALGRYEDWRHLHAIEMREVRRRLGLPQAA
jgi:predicted nucleotidyltransferase